MDAPFVVPSLYTTVAILATVIGWLVLVWDWSDSERTRRVCLALIVIVLLISVPLLADVAEDPCNYCKGLEPWSWEWFKRQCFNCD